MVAVTWEILLSMILLLSQIRAVSKVRITLLIEIFSIISFFKHENDPLTSRNLQFLGLLEFFRFSIYVVGGNFTLHQNRVKFAIMVLPYLSPGRLPNIKFLMSHIELLALYHVAITSFKTWLLNAISVNVLGMVINCNVLSDGINIRTC